MWSNDIKCKNMFMIPLKKLGLSMAYLCCSYSSCPSSAPHQWGVSRRRHWPASHHPHCHPSHHHPHSTAPEGPRHHDSGCTCGEQRATWYSTDHQRRLRPGSLHTEDHHQPLGTTDPLTGQLTYQVVCRHDRFGSDS